MNSMPEQTINHDDRTGLHVVLWTRDGKLYRIYVDYLHEPRAVDGSRRDLRLGCLEWTGSKWIIKSDRQERMVNELKRAFGSSAGLLSAMHCIELERWRPPTFAELRNIAERQQQSIEAIDEATPDADRLLGGL